MRLDYEHSLHLRSKARPRTGLHPQEPHLGVLTPQSEMNTLFIRGTESVGWFTLNRGQQISSAVAGLSELFLRSR